MKKTILLSLLTIFLASTSFAIALNFLNQSGLDTDRNEYIDLALESSSFEEEVFDLVNDEIRKFNEVADLIKASVSTRLEILREIKTDLDENKIWSKNKRKKYQRILDDLPNNGQYATRDVHRKTHGCYPATVTMEKGIKEKINAQTKIYREERAGENTSNKNWLPEEVNVDQELGVFQSGAKYSAILRLSNGHPENRHDNLPDARGFAVKFLPSQLDLDNLDSEAANKSTLLDILTINFPTFFVNSASKYLFTNKWFLASAEDDASFIEKKFKELVSLGKFDDLEKKLALKVNGSIIAHPLYEDYFSMVPSRLGPKGKVRAVKYVWLPEACDGGELKDKKVYKPKWTLTHNYADFFENPLSPILGHNIAPYTGDKNYWNHYYLRDRVKETLSKGKFCYGLHVQLYRDQESTNIEDSKDIWISSEEERTYWKNNVVNELDENSDYKEKIESKKIAPRIKIATLEVNQLKDDKTAQNSKFCEDLSFNPWHGNIQYHKPLGQISRMKQRVYNAVRRKRHKLNGIDTFNQERSSNN